MKRIFHKLLRASLVVMLCMSFASCEEFLAIFEDDNPVVNPDTGNGGGNNENTENNENNDGLTPEQLALAKKLLAEALEEGAVVTIQFTYEGADYEATFKRIGGEYVLQTPSSARTNRRTLQLSGNAKSWIVPAVIVEGAAILTGDAWQKIDPVQPQALVASLTLDAKPVMHAVIALDDATLTAQASVVNSRINRLSVNQQSVPLQDAKPAALNWDEIVIPWQVVYGGQYIEGFNYMSDNSTYHGRILSLITGVSVESDFNKMVDGLSVTFHGLARTRGEDPEGISGIIEITITKAMTLEAKGFTGTYDTSAHGITVSVTEPASGAVVKFGTEEGTYTLDASPTYTNAGEYTVYYQVTMDGYQTVTGSAIVNIAKAAGSVSYTTKTVEKPVGDANFTNTLTHTGDGTVKYSSSDEKVATVNATTGEVTIVGVGTATITASVTGGTNYAYADDAKTASYTLIVKPVAGLSDYDKKDGTEW